MALHNDIGKKGEDIARNFLKSLSYDILETNWRYKRAEIDIIAKEKDVLVFVEVKSSAAKPVYEPEVTVNRRKKELLIDAASQYMIKIDHQWEIRFDIIGISFLPHQSYQIRHYKDAYFQ